MNNVDGIAGQEKPLMEIPVRQFIEYLSQDEMVFYHGSLSVPACDETVSWFVNMTQHVITTEQV